MADLLSSVSSTLLVLQIGPNYISSPCLFVQVYGASVPASPFLLLAFTVLGNCTKLNPCKRFEFTEE
jgi:hypothetical protein